MKAVSSVLFVFILAAVALNGQTITGRIVNLSGTGLDGKKVQVYLTEGQAHKALFDTTKDGGKFTVVNVVSGVSDDNSVPRGYSISDAYPNPFNPHTYINVTLPERSHVQIEVYNAIGEKVNVNIDQIYGAGTQRTLLELNGLTNGIYYARVTINDRTSAVRKLLLLYGSQHAKITGTVSNSTPAALNKVSLKAVIDSIVVSGNDLETKSFRGFQQNDSVKTDVGNLAVDYRTLTKKLFLSGTLKSERDDLLTGKSVNVFVDKNGYKKSYSVQTDSLSLIRLSDTTVYKANINIKETIDSISVSGYGIRDTVVKPVVEAAGDTLRFSLKVNQLYVEVEGLVYKLLQWTEVDDVRKLPGAAIKIGIDSTVTDETGKYKLRVPMGQHKVVIQHPIIYTRNTTIKVDESIFKDFSVIDTLNFSSQEMYYFNKLFRDPFFNSKTSRWNINPRDVAGTQPKFFIASTDTHFINTQKYHLLERTIKDTRTPVYSNGAIVNPIIENGFISPDSAHSLGYTLIGQSTNFPPGTIASSAVDRDSLGYIIKGGIAYMVGLDDFDLARLGPHENFTILTNGGRIYGFPTVLHNGPVPQYRDLQPFDKKSFIILYSRTVGSMYPDNDKVDLEPAKSKTTGNPIYPDYN